MVIAINEAIDIVHSNSSSNQVFDIVKSFSKVFRKYLFDVDHHNQIYDGKHQENVPSFFLEIVFHKGGCDKEIYEENECHDNSHTITDFDNNVDKRSSNSVKHGELLLVISDLGPNSNDILLVTIFHFPVLFWYFLFEMIFNSFIEFGEAFLRVHFHI